LCPTDGERMWHELLVDSGKYLIEQEKVDAKRLAIASWRNDDHEGMRVAMARFNAVSGELAYTSVDLFLGVECLDSEFDY